MKRLMLALGLAFAAATGLHADTITQWNFNRDGSGNLPASATSPAPSIGSGTASLFGGVNAGGTGFASGTSNGGSSEGIVPPSADPLGNNGWQINEGWNPIGTSFSQGVQFLAGTAGYQDDIVVSWDLRQSNTSSRFSAFQYTLDGFTWTTVSNPAIVTIGTNPLSDGSGSVTTGGLLTRTFGDRWLNKNSINLSGLGAGNNPNFGFRIVAAHDPDGTTFITSSAGTSPINATGTWRFDMVTVEGTVLSVAAPSLVNARPYHSMFPVVPPVEGYHPSRVDTGVSLIQRGASQQTALLSNIISSQQGINGVVLDFDNLAALGDITLEYKMSPPNVFTQAVADWADVPPAPTATLLPDVGQAGSDRVLLTWPNFTIENRYLCIIVIYNGNTIAELYLGHLKGEMDGLGSPSAFIVRTQDIAAVRNELLQSKDASGRTDVDKNGIVRTQDIAQTRLNLTQGLTRVTIPAN